jgi:DNA-binding GntR family transcriptional regulator
MLAPRALYQDVAERLRQQIFGRELEPGAWIDELKLCAELGISRTPLREALKVLASEGLVELLPRRGARVAAVRAEDVVQLFEVLGGLERTAAELAAARRTAKGLAALKRLQERIAAHHAAHERQDYFRVNTELHQAIVAQAGNPVLREMHERLMARVRRVRYQALLSQARWDEALGEHVAILEALEAGDAARAGELMHRHVRRTGEVVREALERGSGTAPKAGAEAG